MLIGGPGFSHSHEDVVFVNMLCVWYARPFFVSKSLQLAVLVSQGVAQVGLVVMGVSIPASEGGRDWSSSACG